MDKTVRSLLTDAFDDMDDNDFKRFRNKLIDRREEPRVRRATVQDMDRMDLADRMVSTFTEVRVIQVAVEVLNAIGCNQIATELAAHLTTTGSTDSSTRSAGEAPRAATGAAFVDKHRVALIQRVDNVASILDELFDQGVITEEGCSLVRSKSTHQEQMRALYTGPLNASGSSGKDIFYAILVKNQKALVNDLNKYT